MTPVAPDAPRTWVYRTAVRASLRDTDGMGHVNNAVYLSWLEEIRTAYVMERRGLSRLEELDFVLASARLDYRAPVYFGEWVDLACAPVRVGTRSWSLAYEARARGDGRRVLEAETVQVQYDYAARRSAPLAGRWRELLEEDLRRAASR